LILQKQQHPDTEGLHLKLNLAVSCARRRAMLRDVRFERDPDAIVMTLPPAEGPAPDRIVINDTHFLFTAHFKKSGADLVLTDDGGKKLVLVGYFALEKRPDLVSPHGAVMSADLVGRLAGPMLLVSTLSPERLPVHRSLAVSRSSAAALPFNTPTALLRISSPATPCSRAML
jgi:hypothetical protein